MNPQRRSNQPEIRATATRDVVVLPRQQATRDPGTAKSHGSSSKGKSSMRQATNVNPSGPASQDSSALRPSNGEHSGNGHHGAGYGNGRTASSDKLPLERAALLDSKNPAGADAADPLRVDVASARRQSSARRRPTRMVEAEHDPERDGIVADDPTGGAFDSTWSMSGRTPQPSSAPQPISQKSATPARPVAPAATSAPALGPVPTAPTGGDPRVVGKAAPLPGSAAHPIQHAPRSGPSAMPAPSAARMAPMNKHVCPFCGTRREDPLAECPACGLPDTEETRGATVARVGPWFVLQARNPSAPGMRFNVLRELVMNGQISAGSILRGPATQQLWTYAARVRGLAHLFGVCWSCNRRLPNPQPGEDADDFCVYCGALQSPPTNPDQQLEALETSETIGTGLSNKAGQVAQMRPGGGHARPALAGAANLQFRETAGPQPHLARRPHIPRPIPPEPRDGGDALLTTRELATAFNLDRKRGVLTELAGMPWGKILLTVLVLAIAVFAVWFAMGPITEMLGLDGSTEPDVRSVVPGEP